MTQYLARRLVLAIPTFLLGIAIVFFAIRLVPGDQLTLLVGEHVISKTDRAELKHQLGLDKPLLVQYWEFTTGLVHGDLGSGTFDKQSVLAKIRLRVPVTFELASLAIILSLLISIPVGVVSAVKRNSPLDYLLRLIAILGLSVPSFVMGTVVLLCLALWFHWAPPAKYVGFADEPVKNLEQFALPSVILAAILAASVMRMTRSMMLEVLGEDYIRVASAKGLRYRVVLRRHAIRNALIPVVTIIGLQIAQLVGGTVVLEQIFGLPGMGRLLIDSLNSRDYPTIQGVDAVIVIGVILVNIVVDMSYAALDPRLRAA